jgi:altronate hydrolase
MIDYQAVQIDSNDNVGVVVCAEVLAGQVVHVKESISLRAVERIGFGHKFALRRIEAGTSIIKYGFPMGVATKTIKAGEWVHIHNVTTALSGESDYAYHKTENAVAPRHIGSFRGYLREDGSVGIRNEIWVLPMVSCVNHTGRMIVEAFQKRYPECRNVFALEQPFGCSQLGDDHMTTVRVLQDIAQHPNAGGVLLLSLGCENNVMADFLSGLGSYDTQRIVPLTIQQEMDETEAGIRILERLWNQAKEDRRSEQPLNKLRVGLKCGASDGFSGITANPLVGRACEMLVANSAGTVLTEVPEMFGAEQILMNRAKDEETFGKIVRLINDFKSYYESHGQPIYENPSPGNKEGGITTLEEKSLGCIQKGGSCEISDVLDYGDRVRTTGLTLLSAPGNDPVSTTAMAAAGCQLLIFTTGRGNPLGGIVPTIKVASNSSMATRKANWIDLNAGELLAGASRQELADRLYTMVLAVANGEFETKSEHAGYKEIGIFKNGVTL